MEIATTLTISLSDNPVPLHSSSQTSKFDTASLALGADQRRAFMQLTIDSLKKIKECSDESLTKMIEEAKLMQYN
jgi:hypothetical protein